MSACGAKRLNLAPGPPLYLAVAAHFVALGQALLLGGGGGLPELDEVAQGDVHRAVGLQFSCNGTRMGRGEGRTVASGGDYRGSGPTCDEVLLSVSLQRHPTHGRGGGCVDGIDVSVGTLEHLFYKKKQVGRFRSVLEST